MTGVLKRRKLTGDRQHTLGSHTWSHKDLTTLSYDQIHDGKLALFPLCLYPSVPASLDLPLLWSSATPPPSLPSSPTSDHPNPC